MNANIAKTINYIKRNGLIQTAYAVRERLEERKLPPYVFKELEHRDRLTQIEQAAVFKTKFSILVPAYETKPIYIRELITSVRRQTYSSWELILADASKTDSVENVAREFADARIKYIRLTENLGISENTNQGLKGCTGDYIGLLDHDDLLTEDALFLMAKRIAEAEESGIKLQVLYSDEDKVNTDLTRYFEPNIKPEFNLDLLLSNNYICHFMVLEAGLLKSLGLRKEYDGAQDHDLVLRASYALKTQYGQGYEKYISHIGQVLYHWRCHEESTALNPNSKLYAYDSGRRAVADYLKVAGIDAEVKELPHMGFFYVEYTAPVWKQRPEIAGIGGRVLKHGRTIAGVMNIDGRVYYEGLHRRNSGGYLHRAACQQTVEAIDIRAAHLGSEAQEILEELKDNLGEPLKDSDYIKLSLELSRRAKEKGLGFIYDPSFWVKL